LITLIKRLISLALLALVANATWHVFLAYSAHYKFRDAVAYAAENRGEKTDDALRDQIAAIAAEADLPVHADDVVVSHVGIATSVKVSYTRPIELVPNRPYAWSFSFQTDTYTHQAPNSVK
jgi:hypothetical protein